MIAPLLPQFDDFAQRFNVRVCTLYSMTELSIPLESGWNPEIAASSGVLRRGYPGYEVRLVDEFDQDVPTGQLGELICRTAEPWTLNLGYFGMPDKSAAMWRNGWFHTGDVFRRDDDGRFYFIDRLKDTIRRRGENVSSFELEREIRRLPGVKECAAVGVPSEMGEQDIFVFVVPVPGFELDGAAVVAGLADRVAGYMVPRFVRIVDELPTTETGKVRKAELQDRALERVRDGEPSHDQRDRGKRAMS